MSKRKPSKKALSRSERKKRTDSIGAGKDAQVEVAHAQPQILPPSDEPETWVVRSMTKSEIEASQKRRRKFRRFGDRSSLPIISETDWVITELGPPFNLGLSEEEIRDRDEALNRFWADYYLRNGKLSKLGIRRIYGVADLCDMIGCSEPTLNKYAKLAGVKTPTRGKKNHRYSKSEFEKIAQAILDSTANRQTKDKVRESLRAIRTPSRHSDRI